MLPVNSRESRDLDSTQTVRAVTVDELYDSHRPRWYAVQLVVSDRAVNLDMMPRLELFTAHRLYAVVGKQNDIQQYALRLGFFADAAEAQEICERLRNYFASPSIVRVSEAEQTRFAQSQPKATAPKPAAPIAPVARPSIASVTTAVRTTTPAAAPRKSPAQKTTAVKSRPKTLGEELVAEAREVIAARSGKHRVIEQSGSWLSRLLGGSKR
jgi:hypothetical protein